MTASKPKQKREPCPSGLPHHWVIGGERDVEGYFPAECRGCGGARRFSGASDPDYLGVYVNYPVSQARFVQRGRRGGPPGDLGDVEGYSPADS